jgi:hypothetical protein
MKIYPKPLPKTGTIFNISIVSTVDKRLEIMTVL